MPSQQQRRHPVVDQRRGTWRLVGGELVQDHRTASQPAQPTTGQR
jgi:hypothetical protein